MEISENEEMLQSATTAKFQLAYSSVPNRRVVQINMLEGIFHKI